MALPAVLTRFAAALAATAALAAPAHAGAQREEALADVVRTALAAAVVDDRMPPAPIFESGQARAQWLATHAARLPVRWLPDATHRAEFLSTVRYEAQRAGLDPQLVLGLIEVESGFRKYAVSSVGARGYMQVMPFWSRTIGDGDAAKLFDARANLRFGCAILRHYLDRERGDLVRALGRYNGSLGRTEYPSAVFAAAVRWGWRAPATPSHAPQTPSADIAQRPAPRPS